MERIQNLSKNISSNTCSNTSVHTTSSFKFIKKGNLQGQTVVITGGSRGIGLAIGLECAKDGANVAILAQTVVENPKLPGTIFSAAKAIQAAGGKGLPIECDIRFEESVKKAIEQVVATFGGIDILINNASAISLTQTLQTDMKRYDLMHQINIRGTFLVSQICIPHLIKSSNPHILNLSPPLNMEAQWFGPHVAYTMAQFGMSMCVLGMHEELREHQIAVNALWPRTAIATAAVENLLGGKESMRRSRNDKIMGESAYVILSSDSTNTTGHYFIDDEVLRSVGVTDFTKYQVDPTVKEEDLILDFFV